MPSLLVLVVCKKSKKFKYESMTESVMSQRIAHPMEKLQRQVRSLVQSKMLKPTDRLWKIAMLYGDEWSYWKNELEDFDFSMQDTISDFLAVETWEEEL